jgi:hypothetical protein
MASLAALDEIIAGGGMTMRDQANLSRIQNEAATADRGRRDAIKQNMAARGMGGSGMDLLAQLQSSQAATDRTAQQGLDVAGMAQDRALESIMQSGRLSGDVRGQDFGEQAQRAEARDAINTFNARNRNAMNQFNVGQVNNMAQTNAGKQLQTDMYNRDTRLDQNKYNTSQAYDAQKASWGARQDTANANTGVSNQQSQYNAQLPQQNFQNQLDVAKGKSGAYAQGTSYYGNQAGRKRDQWGNLIGGAATIGGAFI